MKVGFIGTGNMAGAIIRGLISGAKRPNDIYVFDIDSSKTTELTNDLGVISVSSGSTLIQQVDIVVLAVKPQVLANVLPALKDDIDQSDVITVYIAAGILINQVQSILGDVSIIRVMPNLAAKVGESMSAYCANSIATSQQISDVENIFGMIGDVIELDESQFSIFTAIAGSSPAFLLSYIDALANAGVRHGMTKQNAMRVAAQTVLGTTRLLQESKQHPRELIDQICSPAGTTIEGMMTLNKQGFENAIHEAIKASFDKSEKIM